MRAKQIENSLKKIDLNFMEQLSPVQKNHCFQMFRYYYAEQMGKATQDMVKQQKIKLNLATLQNRQQEEKRQIEENLRKKMASHESNRQKSRQKRIALYKKYEDSWKCKWEQISRKKRREDEQGAEKAEQLWKEAEQFWTNKTKVENSTSTNNHPQTLTKEEQSSMNAFEPNPYFQYWEEDNCICSRLRIHKSKTSGEIRPKHINPTVEQPSRDYCIKQHQKRREQKMTQEEKLNLQACLTTLTRIQQRRHIVHKKREKSVEEARQALQKRLNPEVLQRNKQRSHHFYSNKSRPCRNASLDDKTITKHTSITQTKLSQTIQQRRSSKNRIDQLQSEQREESLLGTLQKIRNHRLETIIKKAVGELKQDALSPFH